MLVGHFMVRNLMMGPIVMRFLMVLGRSLMMGPGGGVRSLHGRPGRSSLLHLPSFSFLPLFLFSIEIVIYFGCGRGHGSG